MTAANPDAKITRDPQDQHQSEPTTPAPGITRRLRRPSDPLTPWWMREDRNVYVLGLVPFLLGMGLPRAARWRARIVSWIPVAFLALDLIVISRFPDSTTPSTPLRWIDPVISIAAYGWLVAGVARYRSSDEHTPSTTTAAAHPIAA